MTATIINLGHICTCGTFSHVSNKQSPTNSTTLAQPLPQDTYDVGHVCREFLQTFSIVWVDGVGNAETNLEKKNSVFFFF